MAFRYSPKIVTNGLVLYLDAANPYSYPGSGTVWNDLSKTQISGSLINGPTYSSANNGSIVFDGSNDYVNLGSILNFTSESFSFSYWVNFNSLTTNIVNQGPVPFFKGQFQISGYYTQVNADGTVNFQTNQAGATQVTSTVPGIISTNSWFNVCYTRNGSSVILYVNGIQPSQTPGVHTNPVSSNQNFVLSTYNNYIYSNIRLSTLLVYNKVLTSGEILQNYNATKGRFGLT